MGIVELLVGTMLALLVLAALTATVATGARLLAVAGARGEVEDTAELALETFLFDARRAGWDPGAAGVAPLVVAAPDAVTFAADLDGDRVVDATSEEQTGWVCARAAQRVSRVVGRQSLPIADGVPACGFRYFDATGAAIAVPAAGLDAPGRARVAAVALDVTLAATGLRGTTARTARVALRRPP